MPIIWRYLLWQYIKVFLLTVIGFVGVLLVSRLDEIAQFAALGGTIKYVALFTAHQIPYILPIAIPIAALISATLLFQGLSDSSELTALRASGTPIHRVIIPVMVAATALSIFNFYVISEGATNSHLAIRRLESEVRSSNPLLFLQNKRILSSLGGYVDVLGRFKNGEYADDVLLAVLNSSNKRLSVVLAEKVIAEKGQIHSKNVTIISPSPAKNSHLPDHLIIENLGKASSSVGELSSLMKQSGWALKPDHLQTPLLVVKTRAEYAKMRALDPKAPIEERRAIRVQINKSLSEFGRRLSLSFAVAAFTLMGCAFGIGIGRDRSMRAIAIIVLMTALYLACFFFAKGFSSRLEFSMSAYFLPLVVVTLLSIWRINKVSRGIE